MYIYLTVVTNDKKLLVCFELIYSNQQILLWFSICFVEQTSSEPEQVVTHKVSTKDGDKDNLKTNDNDGAATSFNLTSIFGIFICLLSSLLMS
jgi:hypothetical protein